MTTPGWSLAAGLEGKRAIVTGAASGIGRATVELFAASGIIVYAIDRDGPALSCVMAELPNPELHGSGVVDIAVIPNLVASVKDAQAHLRRLDILVHPAAALKRQPLAEVQESDWTLQLDTNLKATFFLNRACADIMAAQGTGGRIVNFTSTVWQTGTRANADAYAVSKGGIVTLTRGFAQRYGPKNILVNAISPGQIDTPMQRADNTEAALRAGIEVCPLGRMGRPEEVASVAAFLASDHSSFISGAVVTVSGGASMW